MALAKAGAKGWWDGVVDSLGLVAVVDIFMSRDNTSRLLRCVLCGHVQYRACE